MGAQTAATSDPLLTLLQRYEAELTAFNEATPTRVQDWDKIAENTWFRTQNEIIERQPQATAAAGALLALDHVLNSELFRGSRRVCRVRDALAADQGRPGLYCPHRNGRRKARLKLEPF